MNLLIDSCIGLNLYISWTYWILVQMPEAATVGVLWKKVFFKISQKSQETPVSEETPVNFAKFLRTPFFTDQLWTTASESGYCNNEARDIECVCCRELDTVLIASTKISERVGRISPSSLYGHLPDYWSHVLVLSTW